MQKKIVYTILSLTFIVGIALPGLAWMGSDSYRIPTSVFPGGGAPISSDSYYTNATLGQPMPIEAQNSTSYANYPGFWHTYSSAPFTECTSDQDCDDSNPCTDDSCNQGLCKYANNTASCDDGAYCNGTDTCIDGSCEHSGNPCPGQSCSEDQGCYTPGPEPGPGPDPGPSPPPSGSTTTTVPSTTTTTEPNTTTTTTTVLSTTTTIVPLPECEVTINPISAEVLFWGTLQFEASTSCDEEMVTGTYKWAVDSTIGSSIDEESGLYTAGAFAGNDTVKVIDTINGDIEATAAVIVTPIWPMAYDEMWGEKKYENLLLLRVFRDEFLLNTEVGREYVSILYDNSFEIATLLLQDSSLIAQTREVLDELLISIESLLYGDEMEISQDTIDNFLSLLDDFESKASPGLKTAIKKIRRNIDRGEMFEQLGITISE